MVDSYVSRNKIFPVLEKVCKLKLYANKLKFCLTEASFKAGCIWKVISSVCLRFYPHKTQPIYVFK
jgi:hypothetical protein